MKFLIDTDCVTIWTIAKHHSGYIAINRGDGIYSCKSGYAAAIVAIIQMILNLRYKRAILIDSI